MGYGIWYKYSRLTETLIDRWEILGIDLIGPLPATEAGHKHVCTVTDLFTKWVFARPVKSKSSADVADVILELIYSYGPPTKIISDRGGEFVNEVMFAYIFISHW